MSVSSNTNGKEVIAMPLHVVESTKGFPFEEVTPIRGIVGNRDGHLTVQSPYLFDNLSISNGLPFTVKPITST